MIVGKFADSLLPTWTKRASANSEHIDIQAILRHFVGVNASFWTYCICTICSTLNKNNEVTVVNAGILIIFMLYFEEHIS